jgi:hypothetical protein
MFMSQVVGEKPVTNMAFFINELLAKIEKRENLPSVSRLEKNGKSGTR